MNSNKGGYTNMVTLNQKQISNSIELLNKIRTDEGELFSCYVNGEDKNYKEIENVFIEYFEDNENIGIFTCLVYYGLFRVFIAFEKDTDKYVKELAELIRFVKAKNPDNVLRVHFIADQKKLINGIQKMIQFDPPHPNGWYYTSHEFIMDKGHFKGFVNTSNLEIKTYEPNNINDYALLLDRAMTFVSPPPDFQRNCENLAKNIENKSFFAFYIGNELVGIYWLDNDFYTIEYLAIAPTYQRQGYGCIILSHAINNVLMVQKHKMAKLYCVDWNEKGLSFYKKFGMILKGHTFSMTMK